MASSVESKKVIEARQELAKRELARRFLLPFVERLDPSYMAGWVHKDICRRLERFSRQVMNKESPRLMLLCPPRSGKSQLASRMFPAWHMAHNPNHEVIACSYNLDLARTFSKRVKMAIEDPAFKLVFPEISLDPHNQSSEEWGLQGKLGSYTAAGIGGGITGRGAHVLIIDDPVKSAEEADSQTVLDKIFDWYGSTAYTRLAPGGGVLLIQTWWSDLDLAGRLQTAMHDDPENDQFEVVRYPAIAEQNEYLNTETGQIERYDIEMSQPNLTYLRSAGDALHPERYDVEKLMKIKRTLAPRHWNALYQQNPVPDDGLYFTKDQMKRALLPKRDKCHVFQSWDFAISEKTHNDYTVGVCSLQDYDDTMHIADMTRFKSGDAFFIVEAMLALAKKWYHPSLVIAVEDGQIWRTLSALLFKRMREMKFVVPVEVMRPVTDKQVRARVLQGRMQQGRVSFCDKALWFDAVQNEMLRFPAGTNDDIVDALAWNAHLVVGKAAPRRPRDKGLASWRDKLTGLGVADATHMSA